MARVMERDKAKGSERVSRLRARVLTTPEICLERGYLVTESYKETEGEPPVIRRAKALEKVLKEMTISIEDGELIVGRVTSKQRGAALLPELNWEWLLEEMDTISTREHDRFSPLTEEEKAKMREFLPYWRGKSIGDKWRAMLPENAEEMIRAVGVLNSHPLANWYISHNAPDFEAVLTGGLNGIKEKVDEELGRLDLTGIKYLDKFLFLKAIKITLDAAASFAGRYAELARSLAEKETDTQRKAELERIAETCDRVPANPARSFYEALQSVWLTFVALMVEGWGPGIAFGRCDQYLYPFYKKDKEEGRLTDEEALELISLFYIKMSEMVPLRSSENVAVIVGFPMQLDITLGGITKDGKDAVNELSYLFLDADEVVRFASPDIVIRINRITPDAFLMRACRALKTLRGKYKFVSDATTIQQLLKDGKPADHARDYIVAGCLAPTVAGHAFDLPAGSLNIPLMLELALNNGVSRLSGKQLGPKTGDPREFKSYDEVWDAYKRQVEAQIPLFIFFINANRQPWVDFVPTPLQSALFDGCIEKGPDMAAGGTAPYITYGLACPGAPNVADSLAAIKKAVFEDKKITMDRLIDALDKNFEGEEEILHILKGAPKFGNDSDFVDAILNDVITHFSDGVATYKTLGGALTTTAAAAVSGNLQMGAVVGALPDGRRAGEPTAEGGLSPHQGRNVSGPTSTMRSVAKIDQLKLTNGSVLNMRFSPDALKDEPKMRKFTSLIRTFCETGGYLVQFNVTSTEMFRDAQKHPEKYRDLLVRVATYSAYFVEISREFQDDIIGRTEFEEA